MKLIGHELKEVQILLHRRVEKQRLESEDCLTFQQCRVLGYLDDNQDKDVYQKDIEKLLNIRRSTATEMLNILEKDNHIKRVSQETGDKRLKKIVLTKKAKVNQDEVKSRISQTEELMREGINEEEIEVFFSVIDRIKENLKKQEIKYD